MQTKLQERLTKLEQERTQLVATVSAYDGAIQEVKYWLSQTEEDSKVTEIAA